MAKRNAETVRHVNVRHLASDLESVDTANDVDLALAIDAVRVQIVLGSRFDADAMYGLFVSP